MPVRYGIIGCGAIAQRRHIPECLANPDAKLVALADPVKSRVEDLGKAYGAKAYTDYHEMLKNPDVAWFPRGFGQTWQAGMNLGGGVRWLMPQSEYELNPNLTLADQATGCKPGERPVNF